MFPNISLLWWRAEVFLTWEKRWLVTLDLGEQQKMRKRKYLFFLFPFEVPRSVSADGPSNENNLRRTISVMATTDVYAFQYRRGSYKESLVKKFMVWWKTFELSLVSEQHHDGSMYKQTPTILHASLPWYDDTDDQVCAPRGEVVGPQNGVTVDQGGRYITSSMSSTHILNIYIEISLEKIWNIAAYCFFFKKLARNLVVHSILHHIALESC